MPAKFTNNKQARVPWIDLSKAPTEFLDAETIPEDFKILDPSKITKTKVSTLMHHWHARQRCNLPILTFTKAQENDMRELSRSNQRPPMAEKRKAIPYVNLSEPSCDGESDNKARGKEDSESADEPPPSKRSRLSLHPTTVFPSFPSAHHEQSPAANAHEKTRFLLRLSKEMSYNSLMFRALELPAPVSPFSSSTTMSNYCYILGLLRIRFPGQSLAGILFLNPDLTSLGVLGLVTKVSS